MDPLSILFGLILGVLGGLSIGLDRMYNLLEKRDKKTVYLHMHTRAMMFVPDEQMKNCQFVGIERMETKDK